MGKYDISFSLFLFGEALSNFEKLSVGRYPTSSCPSIWTCPGSVIGYSHHRNRLKDRLQTFFIGLRKVVDERSVLLTYVLENGSKYIHIIMYLCPEQKIEQHIILLEIACWFCDIFLFKNLFSCYWIICPESPELCSGAVETEKSGTRLMRVKCENNSDREKRQLVSLLVQALTCSLLPHIQPIITILFDRPAHIHYRNV